MQLAMSGEYAIRAALHLAAQPAGTIVTINQIAEAESIPPKFLRNIIMRLSRQGLVESHRGAGGGVSLGRPANEITLLDIIEASEGKIALNKCLYDRRNICDRTGCCSVHRVWHEAQAKLNEELSRHSLAELVEQTVQLKARIGSCQVN